MVLLKLTGHGAISRQLRPPGLYLETNSTAASWELGIRCLGVERKALETQGQSLPSRRVHGPWTPGSLEAQCQKQDLSRGVNSPKHTQVYVCPQGYRLSTTHTHCPSVNLRVPKPCTGCLLSPDQDHFLELLPRVLTHQPGYLRVLGPDSPSVGPGGPGEGLPSTPPRCPWK